LHNGLARRAGVLLERNADLRRGQRRRTATRQAGFEAVQGFLNFYDSPASATRVAGLLKQYRLAMLAAYAGGAIHSRAAGQQTILQITRQARLGVSHGLRLVVHNPQPLGRAKTDGELAIQADTSSEMSFKRSRSSGSLMVTTLMR
jgi:hypothetical protein